MEIRNWDERYDTFYNAMDKEHIYKYPYAGLFRNYVVSKKIGDMLENLIYIPESAENSRHGVMIVTDQDAVAFAEKEGWFAMADQKGIILQLVSHISDEDILYENYEDLRNRKHFNVNKAFRYVVAYGAAASVAMKMVIKHPQEVAGIVTVGALDVEKDYLGKIGNQLSDLSTVLLREVPVPVWMVSEQENEFISSYWKAANETESVPYLRRGIREYHPVKTSLNAEIDHQTGAMLWISGTHDDQGNVFDPKNFFEYFLSKTQRATGIANGDLNPARTMEEWRVKRHTLLLDGYVREWYEYIPEEKYRYGTKKLPVVVFFHGGSNTAWANICTSEWVRVAQARGFAVVFPSGTVRHREDVSGVPHPAWNAGILEEHMDDVTFVRKIITDIEQRVPIDKERIYTSGHSMGACMSQETALIMPDLFAACAVTGGVIKGKANNNGFFGSYSLPQIQNGYTVPVWIMLGEHDTGGGTFEMNPRSVVNVEYWVKRNKTQEKEKPLIYKTGRYQHRIYKNTAGVPLIDFTTVLDKPHCFTPQDAWFFYDEWFSKYSRSEDGTLFYMGEKVAEKKDE